MINHGRTLLLNISGSNYPDTNYLAEEYVPPGFVAQAIPANLERIRNLLFGVGPDRAMLNYRLRQLLTLVHSCELESHLTDLDSRITYWPLHNAASFSNNSFGALAYLLAGSSTWAIQIQGDPVTASTPRLFDAWQITVTSATSIQVVHLLPANESQTSTYSANSGMSSIISLPGSQLKFTLKAGILGIGNWPTWKLEILSRPLLNLSDLYFALRTNVNQDIENLFSSESEPFLTCRQLWEMQNGPIAYKLGAVVVALIYQLDLTYKSQRQ